MFTHPDLVGFDVRQHVDDLMAEAEHARVLSAALRRRRQARAAARAARHTADAAHQAVPAADATVKAGLRTPGAATARDRFAAGGARSESAADGTLAACEPRAAA